MSIQNNLSHHFKILRIFHYHRSRSRFDTANHAIYGLFHNALFHNGRSAKYRDTLRAADGVLSIRLD